jgi:hypothetical protein
MSSLQVHSKLDPAKAVRDGAGLIQELLEFIVRRHCGGEFREVLNQLQVRTVVVDGGLVRREPHMALIEIREQV